jgi:hypothetical protein
VILIEASSIIPLKFTYQMFKLWMEGDEVIKSKVEERGMGDKRNILITTPVNISFVIIIVFLNLSLLKKLF